MHPYAITVVIPTYRRRTVLRSALESVRNQSRQDLIAEVIVSENSDDTGSLDVAKEFSDLPVRHVFRDPPLDPGSHFHRLVREPATNWVACLGDDDMWGRYHLEEAARCLDAHPEAIAYVGQDVRVFDESRYAGGPAHAPINTHVVQGGLKTIDCWLFGCREMATASLTSTPFNMWALVGRTAAVSSAFAVFAEPDSGHDSDRFMFWELAKHGPIVIGREIDLFYRQHQANACAALLTADYDKHQRKAAEYTRRILDDAAARGIPVKEDWLAALRSLPEGHRRTSLERMIPGARGVVESRWSKDIAALLPRQSPARQLIDVARSVTPPMLWQLARAGRDTVIGRR